MKREWFKITEQKPENLRFIKFVTPGSKRVFRGHYALNSDLRSVHIGQYYNGEVFSFYSESMNKSIAKDEHIDQWAYIDLEGPVEQEG